MSGNPDKKTRHHRKPRFWGGKRNQRNISIVPEHKHRAWHLLFGVQTPEEIAETINETWLDHEWELVARRKE